MPKINRAKIAQTQKKVSKWRNTFYKQKPPKRVNDKIYPTYEGGPKHNNV